MHSKKLVLSSITPSNISLTLPQLALPHTQTNTRTAHTFCYHNLLESFEYESICLTHPKGEKILQICTICMYYCMYIIPSDASVRQRFVESMRVVSGNKNGYLFKSLAISCQTLYSTVAIIEQERLPPLFC